LWVLGELDENYTPGSDCEEGQVRLSHESLSRRGSATQTPPERTSNSEDADHVPSNWAAPHNGPAEGREDQEGAPWLVPPAKPKTGFSPLLRKQARHVSQALIGTTRKLLIEVAQLTDDTHRNKAQARVDGDRSSAHNDSE